MSDLSRFTSSVIDLKGPGSPTKPLLRVSPTVPGSVVDFRQSDAPIQGVTLAAAAPLPARSPRRTEAHVVDPADELGVDGLFRKKNSKFWHVRFKIGGKSIKRSTYMTDREAALAEAKKIRAREECRAVGLPDFDGTAKAKPADLLELYLKEVARKTRRESTREEAPESAHVKTTRKRISVFFAGIDSLRAVTSDHIVEVLERLAAEPITRGIRRRSESTGDEEREVRRSGTTLNGFLGAVRAFFKFLVAKKKWADDPTTGIADFPEGDPTAEYRPMSPAERAALLGCPEIPFERIAAYVMTASTALRRQELLRLSVHDLELTPADGEAAHVRVSRATAKNKRAMRLPLHPDAVAVLARLVEGKSGKDAIFDSLPTHETFRRDVKLAGLEPEKHGYGVLTMTSLRSGLATDLDRTAGATPEQRQKLMRHQTVGLTDRVYTKYELEELSSTIGRLELIPEARRLALGLGEVGHPPREKPDSATENAGVVAGAGAPPSSTFTPPEPGARVLPTQAVGTPRRGGGIGRRARFRF